MNRELHNESMVNEEVMRRMEAISARADILKAIQENLLNPKKKRQLLRGKNIKIGRNDPCPCGAMKEDGITRKKFKKCCLAKSLAPSLLSPDSGFGTTV